MNFLLIKQTSSSAMTLFQEEAGRPLRVITIIEAGFKYPKSFVNTVSGRQMIDEKDTSDMVKVEGFMSYNHDKKRPLEVQYKKELSSIYQELYRCFLDMEKEAFLKLELQFPFNREDCKDFDLKSLLEVRKLLKL